MDFGTKNKMQIFKLIIIGSFVGLCNGLFGAGGGIIAVPALVHFLELDEHDAHATTISAILPLTIVSAFIYHRNGYLDIDIIYKVTLGEVVGATIGAWILHRISSIYLRKTFAFFIIIASIRMIF